MCRKWSALVLPAAVYCRREAREKYVRLPEPTHAPAVGVPMTHTEKVWLHTVCLPVCQCSDLEMCFKIQFLKPAWHQTVVIQINKEGIIKLSVYWHCGTAGIKQQQNTEVFVEQRIPNF